MLSEDDMDKNELRSTIWLRIATARKVAGLDQDALSAAICVNKQSLSRWERGLRTPNAEHLHDIAIVCGCTADFLLGFSDVIKVR